jgi:tetratricopeptide (TPR) repeat protein
MLRRRRPWRRRRLERAANRAQRAMQYAHQLYEQGDYLQAGSIYQELAQLSEQTGRRQQAPFLFLQAARCCMRTQQLDQGAKLAHHGLEILTDDERWEAVHRVTPQLIDDLEQYDLPDYAQKIRQWYAQIEARHPKEVGNLTIQTSATSLNLPTHCEGCGAPLRPAEVQKLDAHTVECAYCGSPIKV